MGKEIQTLSQNNTIYIASFIVTLKDVELSKDISDNKYFLYRLTKLKRILLVLTHPWYPAVFAARSSYYFKKNIERMIEKYNITAIHAEYTSMGQYLCYIKRHYPHILCTLVEHDFTEQSYQRKISNTKNFLLRWYFKIQLKLVHIYEKKYCLLSDYVLTFNNKDKKLIETSYGIKNVFTINPYYGLDNLDQRVLKKSPQICFVGQMGRSENDKAALRLIKIYTKVKRVYPNIKLVIIGNNPSSKLRKYQSDVIRITGFVEDIDSEISQCILGVFPLTEGAGIKLKVLRSLALGVPVITTAVGAEGIDDQGDILKIVETDNDFEHSIISALSNFNELMKWSQKGIKYVEQNFSWVKSAKVLNDIYK